jgi:hypothetical protein
MRSEGHAADGGVKPTLLELATIARDEVERFTDIAVSRGIDPGYDGPEHGVGIVGEPYLLRVDQQPARQRHSLQHHRQLGHAFHRRPASTLTRGR